MARKLNLFAFGDVDRFSVVQYANSIYLSSRNAVKMYGYLQCDVKFHDSGPILVSKQS